MHIFKTGKLLLVICSILAITGCKQDNLINKYNKEIVEFESFLNAHCYQENAKYKVYSDSLDIDEPIFYKYSDEDKIIVNNSKIEDIKELYSLNHSYIEGNGFKVFKNCNNNYMFEDKSFSVRNAITSIDSSSTSSLLKIKVNATKLATSLFDVLQNKVIVDGSYKFSIDYSSLNLHIMFEENVVKEVDIVFDSNVTFCRVIYSNIVYGDVLTKKPAINDEEYTEVDDNTFELIKKDIYNYSIGGYGFTIQPYTERLPYLNDEMPNENDIVAVFSFLSEGIKKNILFKETIFNNVDYSCTYVYAGRPFTTSIVHIEVDYLNCVETIDSNQTIDYKRGNLLRFDYNYKHVVMKMTNNSFSIFDINTLKTAKTYEVEGDIVNILIHEEVYHIMTVTKYDENNRNDANCEGKIYVISGLTLEIVDTISLNTYPYSTAVDKRGDIILSPGCGEYTPIYLIKNGVMEIIAENYYQYGKFIDYNKEKDEFVVNDMFVTGAVHPKRFKYNEATSSYEYDSSFNNNNYTGYGLVNFSFNHYMMVKKYSELVDVYDWEHPTTKFSSWDIYSRNEVEIFFHEEDAIYLISYCGDRGYYEGSHYKLRKLCLEENRDVVVKEYCVMIDVYQYTFGFVKNSMLYFYNSETNAFSVVEFPY